MPERSASFDDGGSRRRRIATAKAAVSITFIAAHAKAFKPGHDLVEFGLVKAVQVQIEFRLAQRRQFRPQEVIVPPRVFGEAIVGDHKRPTMGFG